MFSLIERSEVSEILNGHREFTSVLELDDPLLLNFIKLLCFSDDLPEMDQTKKMAYVAHLEKARGFVSEHAIKAKDKKPHGISVKVISAPHLLVDLEGWDQCEFLILHLCYLLELYIKVIRGETSSPVEDTSAFLKVLSDELWLTANAYRIKYIYQKICSPSDNAAKEEQLKKFSSEFVEALMKQLVAMEEGHEIIFPCGLKGHATYLAFVRAGEGCLLRMDNVGFGTSMVHPEQGKINFHENQEDGKIDARVLFAFSLAGSKEGDESLRANLSGYIKAICMAKYEPIKNEKDEPIECVESEKAQNKVLSCLYDHNNTFLNASSEVASAWGFPLPPQTTEHCVLDSFKVGMIYRFWRLKGTNDDVVFNWLINEESKFAVTVKKSEHKLQRTHFDSIFAAREKRLNETLLVQYELGSPELNNAVEAILKKRQESDIKKLLDESSLIEDKFKQIVILSTAWQLGKLLNLKTKSWKDSIKKNNEILKDCESQLSVDENENFFHRFSGLGPPSVLAFLVSNRCTLFGSKNEKDEKKQKNKNALRVAFKGCAPLMFAIKKNQVDMVQFLFFNNKVPISLVGIEELIEGHPTPLLFALAKGRYSIASLILDKVKKEVEALPDERYLRDFIDFQWKKSECSSFCPELEDGFNALDYTLKYRQEDLTTKLRGMRATSSFEVASAKIFLEYKKETSALPIGKQRKQERFYETQKSDFRTDEYSSYLTSFGTRGLQKAPQREALNSYPNLASPLGARFENTTGRSLGYSRGNEPSFFTGKNPRFAREKRSSEISYFSVNDKDDDDGFGAYYEVTIDYSEIDDFFLPDLHNILDGYITHNLTYIKDSCVNSRRGLIRRLAFEEERAANNLVSELEGVLQRKHPTLFSSHLRDSLSMLNRK